MSVQNIGGLLDGVFGLGGPFGQTPTIASQLPIGNGVQYNPLTLNRILLSYAYMGYGLVQTVIDMPVEDGFRGGVDIETDELDEEEHQTLARYMEENGDWESVKETLKWKRLFGGAGLIIEDGEENTRQPFDPSKLTPDSILRFVPADRWELTMTGSELLQMSSVGNRIQQNDANEVPYLYYTQALNRTRVIKVNGKKAPSYIRLRLQGWGMSRLESCLREINSFVKFQNVIFELLDEKKIDIFKIKNFNNALTSAVGINAIQKRIALNIALKNYKNATAMDTDDDFEQKELTMAGIADIYAEMRQNLAASLQMPEAKLFGQSSSGFSSGEDVIENYNAQVESDVRQSSKPLVHSIIDLRCQQLFGFIPEYEIKFKPLRVLNEVEQEAVNTSKQNRSMQLFTSRLYTPKEVMDSLDKDKLVNVLTEIQQGLRDDDEIVAPIETEDDTISQGKENAIGEILAKRAEKEREIFASRDHKIMKWLRRNK